MKRLLVSMILCIAMALSFSVHVLGAPALDNPPAAGSEADTAPFMDTAGTFVTINYDGINLLSAPTHWSVVLGKLNKGDVVEALWMFTDDKWCYVYSPKHGIHGYVDARYVRI